MHAVSNFSRLGIIPFDPPEIPEETELTRSQAERLRRQLDALDDAVRIAAEVSATLRRTISR